MGRRRYLSGMDAIPIPLRIAIIERHPLMREALCAAIASEPGLELVAEAASGSEALSLVPTLRPDVILVSLGNPRLGYQETLAAFRHVLPGAFIFGLVDDELPGQAEAALRAGAGAVLKKTAPRAELVQILRNVLPVRSCPK
jgi:DNA-binding NarL/FixJ family response regulator